MPSSSKTPAGMIMAGIIQTREHFLRNIDLGNYYEAAWALADVAALLPEEAYKAGFKIEPPRSLGQIDKITPEEKKAYRIYCETHRFNVNRQIPQYVYRFFLEGRKKKQGY